PISDHVWSDFSTITLPYNIASLISDLSYTAHTLFFFFFNAPPPTEIYTLSLHDALPIYCACSSVWRLANSRCASACCRSSRRWRDRKSTRLNSSHVKISYAVFCLKKKKKKERQKSREEGVMYWLQVQDSRAPARPVRTRR